ncbi:MAG TPA: tRNA (adenosine(37)-N6)-dimethylallyltransferase MiaA [Candidatus Paceibacterota bacterium]|nr:tRNA (adenosine(37)-N6)-dimethylallyltransferase MiaA [Candidatus Paceibacterota bacterium]
MESVKSTERVLKQNNKKLLVILGPTASGKSDLAIKLAKLFNGEIISADSRQVYKGMDIGSGKVPLKKIKGKLYSNGIRHHLIDVANPQEYFSAAQYQKLALKAIKDIQKRGKLPILCGGTGLYISSVVEGWQFPKAKPNLKLRKELENLTGEELFLKLKKLDARRAKAIDKNNKRRLIRALEIILQNKKIEPLKKNPLKMEVLVIGIKKDKEVLRQKIKKRLEKRLKEGMIKEVKKLKQKGVSSKRLEDFGLEYRWVNRYLEKKIDYKEMKETLEKEIIKYAKRQMTWFKNKIKRVKWVQLEKEAIILVKKFLEKKN